MQEAYKTIQWKCLTLIESHNSFYYIIASCQFMKTYDGKKSYGLGYFWGSKCDKEEIRIMICWVYFDLPDPNAM